MSSTPEEREELRQRIQVKTVSVSDAVMLKRKAEQNIRDILSEYEKLTGCLVCDIGFWHFPGKDGVEKVEMRVELR